MRDRLLANELFSPRKFFGDLVIGLANRKGAMFPSADFHRALEFAVQRDLERFMSARNRALDAAEMAQHRHTVVNGWALGGTTATQHQPPKISEEFWNARAARPDPSAGNAQHFRQRPALEICVRKAQHMREVAAARRIAQSV